MKRLLTTLALGAAFCSPAFSITVDFHNSDIGDSDNMLFNNGDTGSLLVPIKGTFNNSSFVIDFTSSSGSTALKTSGSGQAALEGGTGNAPYTQLTLWPENGATFTGIQFNLDANADETANFTVNFLSGSGSPFTKSLQLDNNGQNRIAVLADGSEEISSISLTITAPEVNEASIHALAQVVLGLNDVKQVRVAGLEAPDTGLPPEGTLPDGGATAMLLGGGISALALLRRKLS